MTRSGLLLFVTESYPHSTPKTQQNRSKVRVSIIPIGFFLSLHLSLNSTMIFFISSSTAALEGAHTSTRFCLILAFEFSSKCPLLWFHNSPHAPDRRTKNTSELLCHFILFLYFHVCLQVPLTES